MIELEQRALTATILTIEEVRFISKAETFWWGQNEVPKWLTRLIDSHERLRLELEGKQISTPAYPAEWSDIMPNERGPLYEIELISTLPIGTGGMNQAMPGREELQQVMKRNLRVVAAYEVLTDHYRHQLAEVERLKTLIRSVIKGDWSITGLQEAIGDI